VHVATDRRFQLPVEPEALWATIANVQDFQEWWPWLRRFDGDRLAPAQHWGCTVQPPLPYTVRFTVHLHEVDAPVSASATVSGDITGDARLTIGPSDAGSEVRLVSHLAPSNGFLRAASRFAGPIVRFGHDWVLDSAVRQFTARAL